MHSAPQSLDLLRDEWQALQPLKKEVEERLWKKLRLEWNYHSNHIEGNTLTYGETALLLLHDQTTGNHSLREYVEMKAHNVGVEHARMLAADRTRVITESDIRDLNRIILKEAFWKAAETAEGLAKRKEIIPGQYKTSPNNVRLQDGSMFHFASVEDTPPRMAALTAWLHEELVRPTLPVAGLVAKLHHDFVLIHPFDDGNGRVARLLVNYVLMRSGHLPLIVRTEDKAGYLTALRLADSGDIQPLVSYLETLASTSLRLGIRAAKGESIDEPNDLDKEIALFIRQQKEHKDSVVLMSAEVLRNLFDLGLREFVEKSNAKLSKFAELFRSYQLLIEPYIPSAGGDPVRVLEAMIRHSEHITQLLLRYGYRDYLGQCQTPFRHDVDITVTFGRFRYQIDGAGQKLVDRPYSEPVLTDEAEKLAGRIQAIVFAQIKKLSGAKE